MSKNLLYPAYFSEPTVQTLFKQIPRNEFPSLAAQLGVDTKVLSAKLPSTPNDKKQALFSQALAIALYLERYHAEQIGTVDSPQRYIKGTLNMFSHFFYRRQEKTELIYFGGTTGETIVGMAGPANSIFTPMQSDIENKNGSRLFSTLPFLIEVLVSDLEIHATRSYMEDPGINLALAFYSMKALSDNGQPSANYSFFAKVKLDSDYVQPDLQPSKHILLASPLYIVSEWRV